MRDEMNQRAPLADFPRSTLHRVRDLRVKCGFVPERSRRGYAGFRGVDVNVAVDALGPITSTTTSTSTNEFRAGDHTIGVRVYEPAPPSGTPRPICVYYHGGGFVVGSVRSHDGLCSRIARNADCVVVSVDYRLAPEHPFPVPANDAIAAYRWTVEHAEELGGVPSCVSVAGDSAGANLSAVVAWHERASAHPPRFQMLVYPATDYSRPYDSHARFASGFLLDAVSMHWYRSHYFGNLGEGREHPMASVLRAPDLSGAARAHIVTAGFDPLRDEGERYAERLASDGVEVDLVCEERLVHGFFSLGGILEAARRAVDRAIDALASGIRR